MKGLTEVAASNFDHTVIENCIAEAENCFKGQVIWSMQFKILILKIACASSVQSQARIRTHLEELNEILTQVSDVLPNTHWLRSIGYWKLDYYFGLLPDVLGNFSEFLSKINCESADLNSPPHLLPGNRLRFANKHQKAIDQPLSELTEFMRGCGTEKANLKESIFNRLKRITNADRVLLMKKNDLKQLVPLDRGFVADDPGLSGFCHSVAWTALQTGQIVKKSWMFGQESQEGLSDSMNALGLLSVMAIPVKKQKEILGVVYLDSQSVMTVFSENELTSLKTVGNLAASLFY